MIPLIDAGAALFCDWDISIHIKEKLEMATGQKVASIFKFGMLVAAVIIVVRIVLELLGAPGYINNIFGVAWLYLILPVVFAFSIVAAGEASPLKVLFKNVLLFAIYTRIMVMVTYMLAYIFKWTASRFSSSAGGNVGENVSSINGLIVIPVRNALFWVVFAVVAGMIIGGITIWLRKMTTHSTSA
jgi:hypothetical protein